MTKFITIDKDALIWAVLTPALKKRFKLALISKVDFGANFVEDELTLTVRGCTKDDLNDRTFNTMPLKLSENKSYIDIYLKKVDEALKQLPENVRPIIKSMSVVYLEIQFIKGEKPNVNSTIYFIDGNDKKDSIKINLNEKK